MKIDAIVIDGEQRSALAVTRSLGKKGIKVAVGAEVQPSLASQSKYCGIAFRYPSPLHSPEQFIECIRRKIGEWQGAVLLPMTDVTLDEILRRRTDFGNGITIPFDEYDKFIQLSDKIALFRYSRELGIPSPRTLISTDYEGNSIPICAIRDIGFPVVVKTGMSNFREEKVWKRGGVRYALDEGELRKIMSEDIFTRFPYLVQERIYGSGVGVFLLLEKGVLKAVFAHRRIREKPPSGGVSVLCESIELPSAAVDSAVKILEGKRWTGVAMVEFKIDEKDGIPKLIEINARFWGSLQLAISSGVDFPFLLYRWARGERIGSTTSYKTGVKSRWELGDLDHLYIRLLKSPSVLSLPNSCPTRMNIVKSFFFDFFRPSVKNEVLQWNDPAPFFYETGKYLRSILDFITK